METRLYLCRHPRGARLRKPGCPGLRRPNYWGVARLSLFLILVACAAPPVRTAPLDGVARWAVQLEGLEREGAVDLLARARCDMVVIDPTNTVLGSEDFETKSVVARLRRSKICIAYLNVGQAEDYRTWWRPYWVAPTTEEPGRPPYLLTVDPDGWPGNYPVAYWDFRWRTVLMGSPDAPLDRILADGFDGAYLDWVAGFAEPAVRAAAKRAGVDPAQAMVDLVRDLRRYARRRNPEFVVIAQNAAELPQLAGVVDGVSQEHVSFTGEANVAWDDPASGDRVAYGDGERAALIGKLKTFRDRGARVFTVDYAADPDHAARARALARKHGFVPFVSRTPLDRLPVGSAANERK